MIIVAGSVHAFRFLVAERDIAVIGEFFVAVEAKQFAVVVRVPDELVFPAL